MTTHADDIEQWFLDHDGDGAFAVTDSVSVAAPNERLDDVVLYTTKPASVGHALSAAAIVPRAIEVVGGYGLPTSHALSQIQNRLAGRDCFYLGDCDPPDLLLFAWLRAQGIAMTYLGLGQRLLAALDLKIKPNWTIELEPSEQASLPLVGRVLPDLKALVGSCCAALLQHGRKLELDATVTFATHQYRSAIGQLIRERH